MLAPKLDWDDYFATIVFPRGENNLLVRQPEFLKAFDGLLASEPLALWRDYLRWHLLSETAGYLSKPLVDEHFAFYGKKLSGATQQRPRWKRVLAAEDAAIGEDLGQLYVQKAFSAAAKARAQIMVDFIKQAMREHIRAAKWMSEATKAQAYKKLDTMRSKVGYPDKWRDYGKLDIARRPYVLNALAANAFEFNRQMAKLGKPVDRSEWEMTPQTNNAYYEPTLNEMCFPAGILQPPFFDEKADDAVNYGAIARRWTRTDPRLRRSGPPIRLGRQPEKLVDRRGRQGLPIPRRSRGAAIRRLRGVARTAYQRPSDIGRKHRRRWRAARVVHGLPACDQGQNTDADRRLHAGPAVLHRLCPKLANQRAAGGGAVARRQRRA